MCDDAHEKDLQCLFNFPPKIGENPELEEEFLKELGQAAYNLLNDYSLELNRIGVYGLKYMADEDHYNILINITDGMLSILPFIPDETREKCFKKYALNVQEIAKKFGDDGEFWPAEAFQQLIGENFFVISVWPCKIKKFKAEFVMAVGVLLGERCIFVHLPSERGIEISKFCILRDWSRQPEKLQEHLTDYFNEWILSPNCWQTARDRRIMFFASLAGQTLQRIFPAHFQSTCLQPRKYCGFIYGFDSIYELEIIKNTNIRTECEKIIGSIVNPGKTAAFLITFDLSSYDNGMDVVLSGPIPYSPLEYEPSADTIARAENIIHFIHIAESDFSADIERAENEDGKMIFDTNAENLAVELLEPLEIKLPM